MSKDPDKNRSGHRVRIKRKRSGAVLKKKFNWWRLFSSVGSIVRLSLLVTTICILVLSPVVAWRYLSSNAVFTIDRVSVFGEFQYMTPENLGKLTDVALNQNFIGFNVADFQKKLQAEPWIKNVKVKRLWFDELEVTIEEERPIAIWNSYDLIDSDGKLFRPVSFPAKSLPNLVGGEEYTKQLLEKLAYIRPRLINIGLDVDTIILDERLSWSILLDNQILVELGTEDFEKRFHRLLNHYDNQVAPKYSEIASIDFRYSSGFAIGWKPVEINSEEMNRSD